MSSAAISRCTPPFPPRHGAANRAAALGEAHRRYTRHVNFREGWRGFLWQGRFASFPMDAPQFLGCARYVELNPVRARLATTARAWRWSSARAHLKGTNDGLVSVGPLLEMAPDWKAYLAGGLAPEARDTLRAHERTGRALGSDSFVMALEARLGRRLRKRKPRPRPKAKKELETRNVSPE